MRIDHPQQEEADINLGQDNGMLSKHEARHVGRKELSLGHTLYNQKRYNEAEGQFRQAADGREKKLGSDHEDTLCSKYWLGVTLHQQEKYSEAEGLLRQAADGQERTFGRDYQDTLKSKHWLGRTLYNQEKYNEAEGLFQQAANGRKRILGKDHQGTLYSKHWLGVTLYQQEKYSKAKGLLRQAADRREKTLGRDHQDTLKSKHWLGRTLYNQEKYNEAEGLFQQAIDGRERTLGKDHEDTLKSKHWLGRTLYDQEKYNEAKGLFQQAIDGRERILGKDHEDTLKSKHWLGRTLYNQEKYNEAEGLFQQAIDGRERTLGKDHEDTLKSKHWLGRTLYDQEKYSEAEGLLQQAADGQERTLGRDHQDTLYSKHWLGYTFYNHKKYSEAEELLRQAADGWERTLGRDHQSTLRGKYWLGRTLYNQKKYSEAEGPLRQAVDGMERTLGRFHQDTLATVRLLLELQLNSSSFLPTSATTQNTPAGRLASFFKEGNESRESYTDSEIGEISSLLKHSNPQWSRVPRTYVILRTIGHPNLLDDLIDADFSDYWLPVTERSLPGCLLPSVKASFVRAQSLVLTKSLDLEKGEKGQHCYYKQGESPPFEMKGILGRGGFGQVDRVLSLISFKEYARKQVPRGLAFRGRQKEDVKQFIAEIEILKRLKHHHIVEFIGSYTDLKYISLIMSPIAEMDLAAYLKRANNSNLPELRTFFGCLATALEFLHEQNVRHKDIKPSNILVSRGRVLFADFGLSLDFTDANGSTTMSMVNGMTPRYCAPEVARHEPRNTMSDIWSLGTVFMEMIVILKGKTTQYIDEFYEQHGSWQAFICINPAALLEFVAELERIGELSDNRALGWTKKMLSPKQQLRPTAFSLVASITGSSHAGEGMGFCGICCVSSEEDFFSD